MDGGLSVSPALQALAQPFGINRTNMLLHDGAMKGVTAPRERRTSKKASRFRLQPIDQTRMPFPGTARAYLSPYRTVLGGDSMHLTGEELRPMKLITAI